MKLLLLMLLVVSPMVKAKTYDLSHRFGIGGGAGWTIPVLKNEFDEFADDDLTYNFHLRYHTSPTDALQLNYQNYEFENTSIAAEVWDLMYLARFNEFDKLTPIFGIGAGVANMRSIEPYDDNLKFAGRVRAGFEYALNSDVFLSLTADYQFIGKPPHNGEDDNDWEMGLPGQEIHAVVPQLNLTIFFGPDKEAEEDQDPAPAPTVVSAYALEMSAAATDGDKDGVNDSYDKCPGTPAGLWVNSFGCAEGELAQIEVKVLFAPGSTRMEEGSNAALADLANFLKQNPMTKAEIQGHTDNLGRGAKNLSLSQQRANQVMLHLIEQHQIDPSRLMAKGYGEQRPVADNSTEEGRSQNRRVIAVITE